MPATPHATLPRPAARVHHNPYATRDLIPPSPGTPGEGRGGGLSDRKSESPNRKSRPHPNPPPEYRGRGQKPPHVLQLPGKKTRQRLKESLFHRPPLPHLIRDPLGLVLVFFEHFGLLRRETLIEHV